MLRRPAGVRGDPTVQRLRRAFERRCLDDESVRCAVLLTPDGPDGGLRPKVIWPIGSVPPPSLLQAAVAATRSRAPLVTLLDERRLDGPRLLSTRIEDPRRLLGVLAVLFDGPPVAVATHLDAWLSLRSIGAESVAAGDAPVDAGDRATRAPASASASPPVTVPSPSARVPRPAAAAADVDFPSARPTDTPPGSDPVRDPDLQPDPGPEPDPHARPDPDARLDPDARPDPDPQPAPAAESGRILECHAALVDAADLDGALRGLLGVVARQHACRRVAFGWWHAAGTRVAALSDSAGGAPSNEVAAPLATAMDEAIDQQACIAWPPVDSDAALHVPVAQAQAARFGHVAVVCSVPLFAGGRPVGALVLERDDHRFDAADLEVLGRLAAFVAPMLALRRQAARPLRTFVAGLRERLFGPGRRLGAVLAVAALALAAMLLVPVTDRVSAPSRIEGETQRTLTAPVDGWLMKVHVRPGDRVTVDQLLVELDDRDLELERLRWHTEAEQAERQATEALAREDRSQYAVHAAKASQARSQRDLVDAQLARQRVRAPFDGIVLSGDLTQSLGAPVRAGDTLLTIAPGDRHRVIVDVDERDVARLSPGARGELALSAKAGRRVPVEVVRIAPAAGVRDGRTIFEVEAKPLADTELRPGYQGVAKFDAPPRPIAAVLFGRPWRTLVDRLWALGW
jgi:multidrug efflux pump subunit AcrA (membrane-fusion protein)